MHRHLESKIYRLYTKLSPKRKTQKPPIFSTALQFTVPTLALLLSFSSMSLANPVSGIVESGKATITNNANTTIINQTTKQGIINWQSFNIQKGEGTHFQQPVGGVTLNRINPAQGASEIYGRLSSTGQVFLVNPAGIYFGPSALVNVGGIVASTKDLTDSNFLAGNYNFNVASTYNGAVVNDGSINARMNGLVALLGSSSVNNGSIVANTGNVVLASGEAFTISMDKGKLINFTVTEQAKKAGVDHNGKALTVGVSNTGKVLVPGGQILLSAQAAKSILDNAINMSGVLQASTAKETAGQVIILSDAGGSATVSGKIRAAGRQKGQKGGTVKILAGNHISLTESAEVDASGRANGGQVFIGGNTHGTELRAQSLNIAKGSNVKADALVNGKGGQIIVWAEKNSTAHGYLGAKGGQLAGDGGLVETSGGKVDFNGISVSTKSFKGKTGTWLIDPADITISNSLLNTDITNNSGSTIFQPDALIPLVNITTSNLTATTLGDALANNNVLVETSPCAGLGTCNTNTGNINLGNSGSLSDLVTGWGSASTTLTLHADNNITLSADLNVGTSGSKGIVFSAGHTTTSGSVTLNNALNGNLAVTINPGSTGSATINTAQGATNALTSFTVSGPVNLNANVTTSGAQSYSNSITAGTTAISGSTMSFGGNVTGSNFSVTSTAALNLPTVDITGNLAATGAGITEAGNLTVGGTSTFNAGANEIDLSTGTNNFSGAVSVNNSGTNDVDITSAAALAFGTSSIGSGNLNIITGGDLTETGAITQAASAGDINISATNATTNVYLDTQANDFNGNINFDGTLANIQDVGLRNIDLNANVPTNLNDLINLRNLNVVFDNTGITFNGITLSGNLSATAGGSGGMVTETDNTVVAGTTTINAGANSVYMDYYDFYTGAVTISNSGPNDIELTSYATTPLLLGNISNGAGNLDFYGLGGTIQVPGTAITQAANAISAQLYSDQGDVIATNAGNLFTSPTSLNSAGNYALSYFNNGPLEIGWDFFGTGPVNISAARSITGDTANPGPIVQYLGGTGTITLTTTVPNSDILIGYDGNYILGNVTFGGTLSNIRDVAFNNTTTGATFPTNLTSLSNLRNLSVQFDNNSATMPALSIPGTLMMEATEITVPSGSNLTGGTGIHLGAPTINLGADLSCSTGFVQLGGQTTLNTDVTISAPNIFVNSDLFGGTNSLTLSMTGSDGGAFVFYNTVNFTNPSTSNIIITGLSAAETYLDVSNTLDSSLTYNITGFDTGTLTGDNFGATYSNIQNIFGNTNTNDFIFANGASLSGGITGTGAGTNNTIDYTAYTTPLAFTLTGEATGQVVNSSMAQINTFANIGNNLLNGSGHSLTLANNSDTLTLGLSSGTIQAGVSSTSFTDIAQYTSVNSTNPVNFVTTPVTYGPGSNQVTLGGTAVITFTNFNESLFTPAP